MDQKWMVLVVTSLGVFMVSLDWTIVNIAFPNIVREYPQARLSDLS